MRVSAKLRTNFEIFGYDFRLQKQNNPHPGLGLMAISSSENRRRLGGVTAPFGSLESLLIHYCHKDLTRGGAGVLVANL